MLQRHAVIVDDMQTIQQPSEPKNLTLILGGTGKTGRRVANRVAALGKPVRIGSRSGEPPFDWDDRATWQPALRNVAAVYVTYQPDLAFPGAADAIRAFANMAAESGVKRLVLLSGRGEEGARLGEEAIQASGVEWTIVRASFFFQNFDEGFFVDQVRSGDVYFPGGSVAEPFIDADDIADVVTEALTTDRHVGKLYDVTGPRLLTFAEAVGEIGKAAGRDIRYIVISGKEYEEAMVKDGVPADFAAQLTELFTTVLDGRNARVTDGIQRALGRPPRDFAAYARAAAATGVWSAR